MKLFDPKQAPQVVQLPPDWKLYAWAYRNLIGQDKDWTPIVKSRSVTASANVNPLDDLILVDCTSGAVTLTLETAVGCDGRRHSFKKIDSSSNAMTLDGNGSETIDGAATVSRTDQYGVLIVESNGTNWVLLTPVNAVFVNLTVTGNTLLGDASGDTLTINAGTWTIGNNYVATRAIGSAPAGSTLGSDYLTTFSGHSGGTSDVRAVRNIIASSGANAIADTRVNYSGVEINTTAGATAAAYVQHAYIWLKDAGTLTNGRVYEGHLRVDSTGGISDAIVFSVATPTLNGTGTLLNTVTGFNCTDIGHATKVDTAFGFRSVNITGSATLTVGFESGMNSGTGKWGFRASGTADNAFAGNVRIGSTTAPTVQLDVTGAATISGTLTASALVDISGASAGQIKFPGTQNASADANTLDDYEEGTWTPVLTFATPGNLSVAYSQQQGQYTKIGNSVRTNFNIVTSTFTHTTASGSCNITGFPFTSANVTNSRHRGALEWEGITKANYTNIVTALTANVTTATLQASGSGQAQTGIATGDMPTGGTVILRSTITYQTA